MEPTTGDGVPSSAEQMDVEADASLSKAEPAAGEAQAVADATPTGPALTAASGTDAYAGGSISILRLTFHDDVDTDGAVTLSGAEKIERVQSSLKHTCAAQGRGGGVSHQGQSFTRINRGGLLAYPRMSRTRMPCGMR